MKNKTNIKPKTRNAGTFTTVSLKLLNNNNLSRDARFLLIQIFSDSDEFTFSPTLYADRMGCTEKHIYNKVVELENHGFAKRTPLSIDSYVKGLKKKGSEKILYHYTFSEYGNLNKSDEQLSVPFEAKIEEQSTPTPNSISLKDKIKKNNNLFIKYSDEVTQYLEFSDVYEAYEELYTKHKSKDEHLDFYSFRNEFSKVLTKKKKEIFNECLEVTTKIGDRVSKKTITEYTKWLKHQVFETHELNFNHQKKWSYIKQQNQIFKTDLETAAYDQLEEAYHDGDY